MGCSKYLLLAACSLASCTDQSHRDAVPGVPFAGSDEQDASQGASPVPEDAAQDTGESDAADDLSVTKDSGTAHDGAVTADDGAVTADDGAVTAERYSLLVPERWSPVAAAEDPFIDRPAVVSCPAQAVVAELLSGESVFGIDTGTCNYVTAFQRTSRAVAVGQTIEVRLWHFELVAPEPAEGHAALVVDGLRILDERVPIPQAGGLITKELRVEQPIAAGSQAFFHLHNHGANSWALVEVSAGP